ncbi:FUN14 family-domain-containing protein [Phlebopus sp. FC_14]|nr:FUN14 family-domain-containing protein [Phlebopus sp. FC_14]
MASFLLRTGVVGLGPLGQPTAFLRPQTLKQFSVTTRTQSLSVRSIRSPLESWILQRAPRRGFPLLLTATGLGGVGLGITSYTTPTTLHCDAPARPVDPSPSLPPPPQSSVNYYELTFGTVCGICAGVFIKKGFRLIAFFLGGAFVFLQYLSSVSLVKVDWNAMASRFENLFYTTDALGNKRPPSIWSVWRWMVDFLTADFQPRASFIAGLVLGLRVG